MWEIKVILPRSTPASCLHVFGEVFETTSVFETAGKKNWLVQIILTQPPCNDINEQISLICEPFSSPLPNITITKLPDKDWLAENRKAFPALEIAGFYIHGSHLTPVKSDLISIQVDASLAFGTGEHATTQGCLEMISALSKPASNDHILDLGCGTAILAIAMAKLWQHPILAADIDLDSVKMARQNCKDNGVENFVNASQSDGFSDPHLIDQAPYHLIVANILAQPLCELAPDIKKYCTKKADLILSGLLIEQQNQVIKAYEQQGFSLIDKKIIKEWATLHLKLC